MEDARLRARQVIFRADTRAGRAFDVVLLVVIIASVLLVMLESVASVRAEHADTLLALEWVVTAIFAAEYCARLWAAEDAGRYARSFFGVIDLLAILPLFLSLLVPGAQSLLVVRSLRLLRVFRVFKMAQWLRQANYLLEAVRASSQKILVFLLTVLLINVIVGSTMYVIEGAEHGFDSMFRGVYWSIVTMSTVGFGDIAPRTATGQTLAAALMILGYSVIAVPTGIVSAEVAQARRAGAEAFCPRCGKEATAAASYCSDCGAALRDAPAGSSPA